jgi:hypothetical protein
VDRNGAWAWFGRAVGIGALFVVLGLAVGATLGPHFPNVAMGIGVVVFGLGGGGFAVLRLGGAGLFAALLGILATTGVALESRRAHVPGLAQDLKAQASATWKTGSGSKSTTHSLVATPLVASASGDVVAFLCRESSERRDPEGEWFVSVAYLHESPSTTCEVPIEKALDGLATAKRKVAANAASRVVRAFTSEQNLRRGANVERALQVPLYGLALYVVGVFFYRKRGARNAG